MVTQYARWLIRWRWLVMLATLVVVGFIASGMRFLEFTTDYRAFFSPSNPQLQAFETMQDTYAKADNVMMVITPKDGNVFTPQTLDSIKWLTEQAWQTPFSNRVESITNFQHTSAVEDDLLVEDLVVDPFTLNQSALDKIKQIALEEPALRKRLINPEATVTSVNITVQLPGKSLHEVPEVANFAQKLADELQARDTNLRVDLTGIVMMNNTFSTEAEGDMATLVPIMFLIIIVTIGLMLRSIVPVVVTLLIIMLSIITGMGAFGWTGLKMTSPLASAPTIILTMAVADAVHLFMNYMAGLRQGMNKQDAMVESIRINFQPVFLTSLTTVLGFMSMNFTDVPPLAHLGNTVAVGVAAAWLLSMTFLPALAVVLPIKARKIDNNQHPLFDVLSRFVNKQRKAILWFFGVTTIAAIALIPRNEINDEFVKYFDTEVPFRQATDYATSTLLGPYTLDISIESGEESGIAEPQFLQTVENFVEFAKTQPEVNHVFTLTDVMKRLNQNMHGDDKTYYRLPEDRELAAQYLLMYEMSLPFGLDLTNQINLEKSATRVTLSLENLSSAQQLRLETIFADWFTEYHPEVKISQASTALIFAHIGQRNASSQTLGVFLSLFVISLILIFAFRSLKIGLVSLIPNLVPAIIAFGIWAIIDGQIGMTVSVVAGVTLGIVVDDTIHFLSKYLRARREQHLSAEAAVHYAYSQVGQALVVTTVVLMAGFSILLLSNFKLNSDLGFLSSMTIGIALLLDLLLLPALLITLEGAKKNVTEETAAIDDDIESSAA
ncbi:MAG: MMPL family transporter [Cellvibrio sp.]|nr:MMPL family transporter [Cellvibrio sp.]